MLILYKIDAIFAIIAKNIKSLAYGCHAPYINVN